MAGSPAHKLGQIIGDMVEAAVEPALRTVAATHSLYLDSKNPRPARNGRKTVVWTDDKGNPHRLDWVLERGGTSKAVGTPVAFIEVAWRRYTKHSKNKAQEIQGALDPLLSKYVQNRPFAATVLAGEFTDPSLTQLRSRGYSVAYFDLASVVAAFQSVGVDVSCVESTSQAVLQSKVDAWNALPAATQQLVGPKLIALNKAAFDAFIAELNSALSRVLVSVRVLGLHGSSVTLTAIPDAINYVNAYVEGAPCQGFEHYEIEVTYSNGDTIRGDFKTKPAAVTFLNTVT